MTKLKTKKLAAIALSTCMAACVGGAVVGFTNTNHASTAYAATANYAVTKNDYNLGTGLKVTENSPLSIPLTVPAGQYFLKVTVTEVAPPEGKEEVEPSFYDMVATVGGEAVYLSSTGGTFSGVVRVNANDTLIISANTANTLTVDVALSDLFIGPETDNALNGIQLKANSSVTIDLKGVGAGEYGILVDLGNQFLNNGAYIEVEVDGAYAVLESDDSYYSAYKGTINVTGKTESITITTTNPADLTISVNLIQAANYEKLPSTATLNLYESVIYSYSVEKSGYYSISTKTTEANATVDVGFMKDPESFDTLSVTEDNFPLYMEAGKTYYFQLTLMPTDWEKPAPTSATVTIAVADWEMPEIALDKAYSVPVTSASDAPVKMDTVFAPGVYNLSLQNIPFNYYWENVTVNAYIGDNVYVLNSDNNYALEKVAISGNKIYLTTSATESTVVSLYIETPEVREYFVLNDATEVTVPAEGTAVYYIENAVPGYYEISLDLPEGAQISVTSSMQDVEIIPVGENAGGFIIRYEAGDFALEFHNYGTEKVSFAAFVYDGIGNVSLKLNETTTVAVTKDTRKTYYLEGIAAGEYSINISNLKGVSGLTVTVDGVEVMLNDGVGTFKVDEAQDANGLLIVTFKSATTGSFDVKVETESMLALNTPTTMKATGYYYYTAYYMELEAGTYTMSLNLPEGLSVTVMAGEDYAVNYGNVSGTFTVAEAGLVPIRFSVYGIGIDVEFNALVKEYSAEGMSLDKAKEITLDATNYSAFYTMELTAGKYSIGLTNGANVKVAVNGVPVGEDGTFTIYEYKEQVVISFIYGGAGEVAFSATVVNVEYYLMNADEPIEITLDGYSSVTYYAELAAGTYTFALDGTELQVMVIIDGEIVIDSGNYEGTFTIAEGSVVTIVFSNNYYTEAAFMAIITK